MSVMRSTASHRSDGCWWYVGVSSAKYRIPLEKSETLIQSPEYVIDIDPYHACQVIVAVLLIIPGCGLGGGMDEHCSAGEWKVYIS